VHLGVLLNHESVHYDVGANRPKESRFLLQTQRNNGVWFHSRHLWAQNEETAHLPDLVDRRSFDQLLGGLQPTAKSPTD
jgi:hypothetical protein